ncbi:hypothetical protein C8024_00605 [Sphingopyxis sp. BSNA05]|nr:hypothetical protein [Sphingopyxis sp. BSNA05]
MLCIHGFRLAKPNGLKWDESGMSAIECWAVQSEPSANALILDIRNSHILCLLRAPTPAIGDAAAPTRKRPFIHVDCRGSYAASISAIKASFFLSQL